MSALPSGPGVAAQLAPAKPKTTGFLHIVRYGAGPAAIYIVRYHRLDLADVHPKPVLAESAQALIDLLEKIGVDFRSGEVRGALQDILRFGSANFPDLWLSNEEMIEKGLVED